MLVSTRSILGSKKILVTAQCCRGRARESGFALAAWRQETLLKQFSEIAVIMTINDEL